MEQLTVDGLQIHDTGILAGINLEIDQKKKNNKIRLETKQIN